MKRFTLAVALLLAASPVAASAQTQWAGNGHYYQFVNTNVDWNGAFAAANASSYLGMQGYLATITSAGENTFIAGLITRSVWLGGSDDVIEGTWTWRNGPEAGQAFTYTNWDLGEPNNFGGGEDYIEMPLHGKWNDVGGPWFPNFVNGYVIEYSGVSSVPEPSSYAVIAVGLVGLGFAARRRRQSAV
ncbi:lectin-like protein [Gemmatimonas sp.]|uniref:lectin-like protein n=1 Tax=Gemmatimonas sp. TaxID=1962908 RepID=UPI003DA58F31